MKTIQHSQGFLRKRKMMLMLPLLVLPFITLAFWALGGGKTFAATLKQTGIDKGLNLQLPGANLKNDKRLDKMSYYDMAAADSEKLRTRMRNDPYFKLKASVVADTAEEDKKNEDVIDDDSLMDSKKGLNVSPYIKSQTTGAGEAKVYARLKQISSALDNAKAASKLPGASRTNENKYNNYTSSDVPAVEKQNVDRLEKMIQDKNYDNGGGDSEMIQINSMLDKVMDIQHPQRIDEKMKQHSLTQKQKVFTVTKQYDHNDTFYTENDVSDNDSANQSNDAIEAVVSETQTLVNGAMIKLRLVNEVYINGMLIPANGFVFGKASLAGERLSVSINSIRYRNSLLPVTLAVYDMDGVDGIYIPGAISRDVVKQSTDNALQSVALNSLDPTIGAQAAGAGIETVKTIISKKVKLVRVTVKAGYRVLIKDDTSK